MAPAEVVDQSVLEGQIRNIIQDLYELMVQAAAYDNVGPGIRSRDVLQTTIKHLHTSLLTLHQTTTPPTNIPHIALPPELIQYVESGRNPDIYTREFVELARRQNQIMKGKEEAFAGFRDVLAREMESALPEVREDVRRVVLATGGRVDLGVGGVGVGGGEGADGVVGEVVVKMEGS